MAAKLGRLLAVVLVASLVLEIGLFNIKCWETLGNSEQAITMARSLSGSGIVYQAQFDNASVNAIAFDLSCADGATATVSLSLTDSGDSAQAYDLPQVTYYSNGHKYLMVETYGYLKSMSISVESSYGNAAISGVSINPQIPFCFQIKRFLLVFALLFAIGLLRPGSALWGIRIGERSRACRVAYMCALVMAVLVVLASFAGSTDDADEPWYNTFAYNEYSQLAHSFSQGKLYLEEEPPAWLVAMDGLSAGEDRLLGENNAYDVSLRTELGEQTGEYCKDDAAYFDGHYYVYFGVVPVVLLYLPFYLITGMDLPDSAAMLFALLMFVLFSWLLLRELGIKRFPRASLGAFLASYATLLCASSIVVSVARPQFYNEPVVFALMFLVMGLFLLLKGYGSKVVRRSCVLLALGSLCIACIAGCRPQLLLIGVVLLWLGYKLWRREEGRIRIGKIACLVVPVVVVAALIMWYNFARFGSVTDFGANYNLAGNDMTLRGFSVVRSFEGIVYYLFATPHISTVFPFVHAFYPESSYMSINMSEPLVMGTFIQCPILLATLYFLVAKRKSRLWLPVAWLVLSGVVIAVFDANGAGILGRYSQDFGVFLGLAACLILLETDSLGGMTGLVRALVSVLTVLMLVLTITYRLSLMTQDSTPTGPRQVTSILVEAQPMFEFWR